jgi:benzoate membrane transport protein
MDEHAASAGTLQPVLAGLVTAVVGFASTFALVLTGLRAVGADEAQAASGLLVLCVGIGLVAIVLGLRYRMPISIAWSTPGAALLVSAGHVSGGYPAALGAFLVTGALIVLTGLARPLEHWIAAIPTPLASAMLAGVLLPICIAPVRAAVELPLSAAPVIVTWLVLVRLSPRWAVPGALAVTAIVIAIDPAGGFGGADRLAPGITATMPTFDAGTLVGLAIPLFIVTMASQNLPGMAVLASYGYRPPLRPVLVTTGAVTAAGAPLGAHAINLAAITAALAAGPEAGPDRDRRWIASVTAGALYVVLGLCAGIATALATAAPPLLIEGVAGLALLGALAAALSAAMDSAEHRDAAIITFVVTASGISTLGIGAPFWGLVAGLAFLGARRVRPRLRR